MAGNYYLNDVNKLQSEIEALVPGVECSREDFDFTLIASLGKRVVFACRPKQDDMNLDGEYWSAELVKAALNGAADDGSLPCVWVV